jgi:hypothetical protein
MCVDEFGRNVWRKLRSSLRTTSEVGLLTSVLLRILFFWDVTHYIPLTGLIATFRYILLPLSSKVQIAQEEWLCVAHKDEGAMTLRKVGKPSVTQRHVFRDVTVSTESELWQPSIYVVLPRRHAALCICTALTLGWRRQQYSTPCSIRKTSSWYNVAITNNDGFHLYSASDSVGSQSGIRETTMDCVL